MLRYLYTVYLAIAVYICAKRRTLKCIPRNIFVSPGDKTVSPDSENFYNLGFTVDPDCTAEIAIELYFSASSKVVLRNPIYKQYDIDSVFFQKPLKYHRKYGFFALDHLPNPDSFEYRFVNPKHETIRGPFKFSSNIYRQGSSLKLIAFGDQDLATGQPLIDQLVRTDFDLLILLGDYGYNINDENGKVGEDYFKAFEPITSSRPVIVIPGNRDHIDETNFLMARFVVPGTKLGETIALKNNCFNFKVGQVAFFALNFDYYLLSNEITRNYMLESMEYNIQKAKMDPEVKFKIFISHRPFYCSRYDFNSNECQSNLFKYKRIYDILAEHSVDVGIAGHIHHYERLSQMFNFKHESTGLRQLIVGTGGSSHLFGEFPKTPLQHLEVQYQGIVGYLQMVSKPRHLHFDFYEINKRSPSDSFTINSDFYLSFILIIEFVAAVLGLVLLSVAMTYGLNKYKKYYPAHKRRRRTKYIEVQTVG